MFKLMKVYDHNKMPPEIQSGFYFYEENVLTFLVGKTYTDLDKEANKWFLENGAEEGEMVLISDVI
jgi:hypothetical protein